MCSEWVEALNQPGFIPKEKSMVCCLHFADEDWSATSTKRRRLKWWAKPSRRLAQLDDQQTEDMVKKKQQERWQHGTNVLLKSLKNHLLFAACPSYVRAALMALCS